MYNILSTDLGENNKISVTYVLIDAYNLESESDICCKGFDFVVK
jgi:hypothetical protein